MNNVIPYKIIRAELAQGWQLLQRVLGTLNDVEKKVIESESALEPVAGRVTPFFIQKTLAFTPLDTTPRSAPLVQSAQRTTKITSLAYAVTFDETQAEINATGPGLVARPKTTFLEATAGTVELFDFEWNYSIGSTDRRYGTGRNLPAGWLSRNSLGNVDSQRELLFSAENPLVLRSHESLEFHARPLHFNLDPDRAYTTNERFYLHLIGTGYRIYDV